MACFGSYFQLRPRHGRGQVIPDATQINALQTRVAQLESMLDQQGISDPPALDSPLVGPIETDRPTVAEACYQLCRDEEVNRLNNELKSENHELKTGKHELKTENNRLREEIGALKSRLANLQAIHDTSLEQDHALSEIIKSKQDIIDELSAQNENLRKQLALHTDDKEAKGEMLLKLQEISELKLDCVKKDSEIDRLKAIENSFKQTKQVLKDTMWTLNVKEEELSNVKLEMRENYEKRMNELVERLNDRDLKVTSLQGEKNSLIEQDNDHMLRVST